MAYRFAIILLVLSALAFVGYGFFAYPASSSLLPEGIGYQPDGEPPPFRAPSIDGKRLFRSDILGFSLYYPDDLFIREYGKGNTSTLTFEDVKGERGFQIFVVPYDAETVSAERFKMDLPSGVMKEAQEIIIDGARGSAFFSEDALVGETREVWFIQNGFLYEVTARKELDAWLAEIMQTWRFL